MQINFGTDCFRILFCLAVSASVLFINNSATAETIVFSEDWETPVITAEPLEIVTNQFIPLDMSLPAGWRSVNSASLAYIQPATNRFTEILPFSPPAGGAQALVLSGTGSRAGVSMVTAPISVNTEYTLSAAIGSTLLTSDNNSDWSLQLWADTSGDGTVSSSDIFLGQTVATSAGASNPSSGEWAVNSISINSDDTPEAIGSNLLVFLNNRFSGISYYDNVSLSSASSVPEPNAVLMISLAGGALASVRRRQLVVS